MKSNSKVREKSQLNQFKFSFYIFYINLVLYHDFDGFFINKNNLKRLEKFEKTLFSMYLVLY